MKNIYTLFFVLFLFSCTTPTKYTNKKLIKYDEHTHYLIENNENILDINVTYARYQFWPEAPALISACKNQLTSIVYEYAEKNNIKINSINEQKIKISTGRNELSGITSCNANLTMKIN